MMPGHIDLRRLPRDQHDPAWDGSIRCEAGQRTGRGHEEGQSVGKSSQRHAVLLVEWEEGRLREPGRTWGGTNAPQNRIAVGTPCRPRTQERGGRLLGNSEGQNLRHCWSLVRYAVPSSAWDRISSKLRFARVPNDSDSQRDSERWTSVQRAVRRSSLVRRGVAGSRRPGSGDLRPPLAVV